MGWDPIFLVPLALLPRKISIKIIFSSSSLFLPAILLHLSPTQQITIATQNPDDSSFRLMDEYESKSKSEHDFAATEYDTISPDNNHSVFGWQNFHSIEHDPFATDSMKFPKSESSSFGGLLLRVSETTSSTCMISDQASTSTIGNNHNNNNPSVSSSSSDQDHQQRLLNKSSSNDQLISQISSKKKEQKRIQQQRFAFVTKSEVDHLEDGYRWRKYGQKAVKNSPYPRSYYRCTNVKCTVKKRVERSCEDPTTVITTYEGQHCHQTAGFPRGGSLSIRDAAFGVQMGPLNSQHYYPGMNLPEQSPQGCIAPTQQPTSVLHACIEPLLPSAAGSTQFPSDEGLLGDIVSPRLPKNFQP